MARALPSGKSIATYGRFTRKDFAAVFAERRRAIVSSYQRTKNYTLTADVFGISAQRVAQIVKRYGGAS